MEAKFVYESLNIEFDNRLYEDLLLEKFNWKKIIPKFKFLSFKNRLKFLSTILLISGGLSMTSTNMEKINNDPKVIDFAKQTAVSEEDIISFITNFGFTKLGYNIEILKHPFTLTASDSIRDFIKNHEKLKLEAYELGDNMITIGYGHAEYKNHSKYKIGHKISKDEAERLFEKDIRKCEAGLRRLFELWDDQGVHVYLSQHMYDALISMSYNMGVGKLRNSEFIQLLKNEKYEEAANKILDTGVKNAKKFPGLIKRRNQEKNIFLKNYII